MVKKLYEYAMDENVDIFLLIESSKARTAKNNKQFLALTFRDKSGKMDGKYWDASDQHIETFQAGEIVHVTGKRESFNGSPQLRINSMRLTEGAEPHNVEDFVEDAPIETEDAVNELNEYLTEITNENYHNIVKFLLNKHYDAYVSSPAAKRLHHAYTGGLMFHTLSILRLEKTIIPLYEGINPSLLYAGTILHDLGKIKEMSGPVNTEYTLEGNLIGHIVIGVEEIDEACRELGIETSAEDIILLKHVILSHHGQLEYGSPKRPVLLEAGVLHALDDLDASITMVTEELAKTEPGKFSSRLFGMDNRSYYKPSDDVQK